jgi:16S rRNA G527 N7-methylase RsmG
MNNEVLVKYYNTAVKEKLYSAKRHLKFKTSLIFRKIDFEGKSMLDIGGGDGLYSFYVACQGAKNVVCLEPEIEGSYGEMNKNFEKMKKTLNLNNISLRKATFQEYEPGSEKFDIVLMHNSINHLDEYACEHLLKSETYWNTYTDLLKKLYAITNEKAQIIISDCSNINFYTRIGIKNIFAPNIEWEKHQAPEVWARLLTEAGFNATKISWNTPKHLGNIGNKLFGNRLFTYFLGSHFRLEMRKN